MNLNEMEIPCDPILDKAKRDDLVQNTDLLKQVTIKPIPWLPGRDYITTEQVARFFDGDVDEVKRLCTKYRKEFLEDGMEVKTVQEIIDGQNATTEKQKGRIIVTYPNGLNISFGYKGAKVFTLKCLIRLSLLMETSSLAESVRHYVFINDYITMEERREQEQIETGVQLVDTTEILGRRIYLYRSIEDPLFLARDVAEWIDYNQTDGKYNVSKMLKTIDSDEKYKTKILGVNNVPTKNLSQETIPTDSNGKSRDPFWFLTEDGLYEVCMQSRKPIAKQMKKQIKEYLRNIRKTGGAVDFGKESQFIEHYFPSFSEDVKLAMVTDLRTQNKELKEENQKLQNDNKLLAAEILTWDDRNKMNAGIRKLAAVTGTQFSVMWNELYKNLQYKYQIDVKKRGKKPFLQWIQEHEWDKVLKVFCAMCEARNLSPTDMFQQTAPVENLYDNEDEDDEVWN
jgi:prophage antirepressor-like protein